MKDWSGKTGAESHKLITEAQGGEKYQIPTSNRP